MLRSWRVIRTSCRRRVPYEPASPSPVLRIADTIRTPVNPTDSILKLDNPAPLLLRTASSYGSLLLTRVLRLPLRYPSRHPRSADSLLHTSASRRPCLRRRAFAPAAEFPRSPHIQGSARLLPHPMILLRSPR